MTLTLRARLAAISAVLFGLLLAALSLVSYQVLERWLDADVTARLAELTDGLHGYLRFDGDAVSVGYDPSDSDQAAFVREATRHYRVYDLETGRVLALSNDLPPAGPPLTAAQVRALRDRPTPFDIERRDGARPRGVPPAGGRLAGADGCGAGALSGPAGVDHPGGAPGRRRRRLVALRVRPAPPVAHGGRGAADRREHARSPAAQPRGGR
jgi:hypothetical protein